MRLKKNGFVHSVAYSATNVNKIPSSTSLCKLFWLFLWKLLFVIPLLYLVGFFVGSIGFILLGKKLNLDDQSEDSPMLIPIQRWPRIKGHPIWPLWAYVIGGAAVALWHDTQTGYELINGIAGTAQVVGYILAVLVIFCGVVLLGSMVRNSQFWDLVGAWFKARKDKVCPIVTFTD